MMGKYNLSNIKHYLVGKLRYKLFYTDNFDWLLRAHISEQIAFRIQFMQDECYNNGSCSMCGCETTALQMANKACDKPCYPTMMNAREWKMFTKGGLYWDNDLNIFWKYFGKENQLIKFKNQKEYYYYVERTKQEFGQDKAENNS